MCAACVMAAAAGASGARSWLQARRWTWLTPRVLRTTTIGLFAAAMIFSSVTISGSTSSAAHASSPRVHQAR